MGGRFRDWYRFVFTCTQSIRIRSLFANQSVYICITHMYILCWDGFFFFFFSKVCMQMFEAQLHLNVIEILMGRQKLLSRFMSTRKHMGLRYSHYSLSMVRIGLTFIIDLYWCSRRKNPHKNPNLFMGWRPWSE